MVGVSLGSAFHALGADIQGCCKQRQPGPVESFLGKERLFVITEMIISAKAVYM